MAASTERVAMQRRIWLDPALAALRELLQEHGRSCAVELLPESGAPQGLGAGDVAVFEGPGPRAGSEALRALAGRVAEVVRGGASRIVLLSSHQVYGNSHHLPGMVTEDQNPPPDGVSPTADHWRAVEESVRSAAATAELVILRPATVPGPLGRGSQARRVVRRLVPCALGYDPTVQFLAPDDLAGAIDAAAKGKAVGCFNVAPADAGQLNGVLETVHARRVPLPRFLHRLWQGAMTGREELAWSSCTVDGRLFGESFGWSPARRTVESLARARGVDVAEDRTWDDFGLDERYIRRKGRQFLEFLHRRYWRVEFAGLEHVPRDGPAVLTSVHRGFMPFDAVLLVHLLAKHGQRIPRFLVHPSLVKFPFLAPFIQKLGGIAASGRNADRILAEGGLVGIFPEGIRGAFTEYRNAYRLGRFGRDEFVRMALRNRAPIVPCVTVGPAEIFPILAKIHWSWIKRFTEWPCLPITPTFPLLPIPLPSKWHTLFLPPMHVEREHPPEAADDRSRVRAISDEVRRRLQVAMDDLRSRRPNAFFGNVFSREPRLMGFPGSEEVA